MKGLHGYYSVVDVPDWGLTARPMGTYNPLVDLMGHEQFGGKTLLYMVDGLYASLTQTKNISRFVSFNNGWTSSLFMSLDPVAIDSVCLDFLRNEPTEEPYVTGAVDNYLHEAAFRDPSTGRAPSGTLYDPEHDGTPLPSLGVHEHWNNATDKKYSRNLGSGNGIELVIPSPIPSKMPTSTRIEKPVTTMCGCSRSNGFNKQIRLPPSLSSFQRHAFLYSNGVMLDLGTLAEQTVEPMASMTAAKWQALPGSQGTRHTMLFFTAEARWLTLTQCCLPVPDGYLWVQSISTIWSGS